MLPEQNEQYDWRPSTLHVLVHTRKKYVRRKQLPESGLTPAEQNVVVAPKPAEAIPGALAAPGLMAQVIVSKGADHLHDIDPWVYHRDILIRLSAVLPGASDEDLLALLPHRWRIA